MRFRYIVDTYAWIAYFNTGSFNQIIDNNQVETPSIVIAELIRTMKRKKIADSEIGRILDFIFQKGSILPLGYYEAIRGGRCAHEKGFSFVDGLVYSYVETPEDQLLSGDEHFKNKPQVIFEKEKS